MSFEMLADESLESWAQRVERYEYGRALMRLAQGDDPVTVAQETSRRIINKLQHPVIAAIHDTVIASAEPYSTLEDYRRDYINRVAPHADHIQES